MTSYRISDKAYTKAAFHAAKYPSKHVNGVFLGKVSPGTVEIEDAVPLLHHWTSLSPAMEIGLSLAATHASSLGLEVVGYYQAADRANDTSLVPVGERIAASLKERLREAIAFIMDGTLLAKGEPALLPYLPQGSSSSWRPASESVELFSTNSPYALVDAQTPIRVSDLIKTTRKFERLGDFDAHLEDVSIDWLRNPECTS